MHIDYGTPVQLELPRIPFPMKEIYKRLQMPQDAVKAHEGVSQFLDEALTLAGPLIQPRGVYVILEKTSDSENMVTFRQSAFQIQSRQVARLLRTSPVTVIFMTTIGQSLEDKAHELSQQGDVTLGFMLDAIASETTDAVADYLHREYIRQIAVQAGYTVTPRFSAGYGDWPITVQGDILEVCEGHRIGISVTETSLMLPRKSVSAVFGWKKI